MNRLLLSLAILASGLVLHAQTMPMPKGKSLGVGDYVEVSYNPGFTLRADSASHCCPTHIVRGTITDAEAGRLMVNADFTGVVEQRTLNRNRQQTYSPSGSGPEVPVDRVDIFEVKAWKSAAAYKRKTNFIGLGGALVVTGVVTGIHSLLVGDDSARRTLLYSAAGQVGAGITFPLTIGRKKYTLREAKSQ